MLDSSNSHSPRFISKEFKGILSSFFVVCFGCYLETLRKKLEEVLDIIQIPTRKMPHFQASIMNQDQVGFIH